MPETKRRHKYQRRQGRRHEAAEAAPANPVAVEVTRGAMVESRHRAAIAVVGADGAAVLAAGETARPVYARSALKPIQALALVETGAAERFALGDQEIALACGSHRGEPRHVETVLGWLERIGCGADDLACGAHLPLDEAATRALLGEGRSPGAVHNNCSGKHAGFLSVARHLGHATEGYIRYDHPVQQLILGILEQMTGLDLGGAPRGIDGCSIPVIGVPLGNLALAMARFADPRDQPDRRQEAAARIRRAMAAEPFMAAGTGSFTTRILEATGDEALIKGGAEGVYLGALPGPGLGIALKVDDGSNRAAQVIMGSLLRRFGVLSEKDAEGLRDLLEPPVLDRAGAEVGRIKACAPSLGDSQ